jgi:hypothetical protein
VLIQGKPRPGKLSQRVISGKSCQKFHRAGKVPGPVIVDAADGAASRRYSVSSFGR